jgi:glucose-1-phosphate thymidylyltransferase
MKGVILAGGTGGRLYPLTKVTNKHLLPVGRYPMIYWPLHSLVQCGLRDILIVTGVEHLDALVRTLGSGREFGCEFTYRVQDEAGGIAQALGLCRAFAAGGPVMAVLGDNVFCGDLGPHVAGFESGARLFLSRHPHPERFGVAELDGDGRITRITEKPPEPATNLVVTGCYVYDAEVFDIIDTLEPSARGELEITDVNNAYVSRGAAASSVLPFAWTDAGTHESLRRASEMVAKGEVGFVAP